MSNLGYQATILSRDSLDRVWQEKMNSFSIILQELEEHDSKMRGLIKELNYPEFEDRDRLSIDESMMLKALSAARRSPDAQTQVGCVITKENRVLSTGYNGFPRDIDYSDMPNTRPYKYPWFLHAEMNALAWCEVRPVDCTLYCTHGICNSCLFYSWQCGIVYAIEGSQKTNLRTNYFRRRTQDSGTFPAKNRNES